MLYPAHRSRLGAKPLSFPIVYLFGILQINNPTMFQTRSFHPVLSVIVHISDVWSSQCPIYENIVIQGETSNTRRLAKIGKGKLQMKWSSSSSITVSEPMLHSSEKARTDEQYRPLCYEERYRLSCTKSKLRLARLSKFYISGPIMTYYQFKHLVVSAESYHEGAEPNQAKLVRSGKRHKV